MSRPVGLGWRLDEFVARHFETKVPDSRNVPRYVSPLPEWLENVGLRLAWPIVVVNLIGTLFGFVYYGPQLSATPVVMWPIVPVSPLATLYIAISLAAWRLGYSNSLVTLVHVLAFFGCLKYGLWSVYVQLFIEDASQIPFLLWQFLIWSHAGMVLQAFFIHRYAGFPLWAVVVTTGWYTFNDVLDYFVSLMGGPHHTWLNVLWRNGQIDRTLAVFDYMVAGAVVCTLLATVLALATWRHL
jgi:uncharacterized membrane protein YpjA